MTTGNHPTAHDSMKLILISRGGMRQNALMDAEPSDLLCVALSDLSG